LIRKKEKNPEPNVQELQDNYKRCDTHEMGIPEREGREKGKEPNI
jgi:hypothetical protein